MDLEKAKETLNRLINSTGGDGSSASHEDDFHEKFARDLDEIEVDVPFQMLFVQENGKIINAAVIQDDVLNSLTESDPEAKDMLEKFKSMTESKVSFEEMGKYVKSPGTV